ncbi:MAG: hypothetical protein CMH25_05900 [Micavibrio sp.]|nr:hypothetical protein [Micavibrio sp.]|tara:strand:+ start:128882 stop:130543 length:1662 start_codon:yes stop_codon:yes gene_type:complete
MNLAATTVLPETSYLGSKRQIEHHDKARDNRADNDVREAKEPRHADKRADKARDTGRNDEARARNDKVPEDVSDSIEEFAAFLVQNFGEDVTAAQIEDVVADSISDGVFEPELFQENLGLLLTSNATTSVLDQLDFSIALGQQIDDIIADGQLVGLDKALSVANPNGASNILEKMAGVPKNEVPVAPQVNVKSEAIPAPNLENVSQMTASTDVVLTDEEVLALHKALQAIQDSLTKKGAQGEIHANKGQFKNALEAVQTRLETLPALPEQASRSALPSKWFEKATGVDRLAAFGDVPVDADTLVTVQVSQGANTSNNGLHGGYGRGNPYGLVAQAAAQGVDNANAFKLDAGLDATLIGDDGTLNFSSGLSSKPAEAPVNILPPVMLPANAAHAVTQLSTSMPATPAGQVVASQLASMNVKEGGQRIAFSLNPEELGRVIADIEIDAKNKIKVNINVEKEAAYHMLQRDHSLLEQALQKAGLDLASGDLEFSFGGQNAFDEAYQEAKVNGAYGANGEVPTGDDVVGEHVDMVADIPQGTYIDAESGITRYHALA